jgi:hypothetical protein
MARNQGVRKRAPGPEHDPQKWKPPLRLDYGQAIDLALVIGLGLEDPAVRSPKEARHRGETMTNRTPFHHLAALAFTGMIASAAAKQQARPGLAEA